MRLQRSKEATKAVVTSEGTATEQSNIVKLLVEGRKLSQKLGQGAYVMGLVGTWEQMVCSAGLNAQVYFNVGHSGVR